MFLFFSFIEREREWKRKGKKMSIVVYLIKLHSAMCNVLTVGKLENILRAYQLMEVELEHVFDHYRPRSHLQYSRARQTIEDQQHARADYKIILWPDCRNYVTTLQSTTEV